MGDPATKFERKLRSALTELHRVIRYAEGQLDLYPVADHKEIKDLRKMEMELTQIFLTRVFGTWEWDGKK